MEQKRDSGLNGARKDAGTGPGSSHSLPRSIGAEQEGFANQAASISLPKGGGAIRGIGEKFGVNPVTGTGSLSVPIATSPGRSGFGPSLSLSYDSGSGNGPFGFGWSLALPSITRKTDKGFPQYFDAQDSDVFILSGAEDLVPVYRQDADGSWVANHAGHQRDPDGLWARDQAGRLAIHEDELDGYRIRRYRPRIEGLFARIERWTKLLTGETHWRSISRDNITTWYGRTANSRIADPSDPARIFSWLICESYDDKGNAVLYQYKQESSDGVDLSLAHERNRTRSANRYLKRIKYANRTPRQPDEDLSRRSDWLFEVVFDYGEHYTEDPSGQPSTVFVEDTHRLWPDRQDSFSTYRASFEVRTCRRCQRVLMFHHFTAEPEVGAGCLVRSTDFTYSSEKNPADARNPIRRRCCSRTARNLRGICEPARCSY